MATNTTPAKSTEAEDTFDRKEVARVVAMVRHELSELSTDANRARPFFSRSQDEARAKRDAAVRALTEFASHIDSVRKS